VAAFRERRGGMTVEIHDLDHGPAHCHISGLPGGLNARVDLYTLEVTKPAGETTPATDAALPEGSAREAARSLGSRDQHGSE